MSGGGGLQVRHPVCAIREENIILRQIKGLSEFAPGCRGRDVAPVRGSSGNRVALPLLSRTRHPVPSRRDFSEHADGWTIFINQRSMALLSLYTKGQVHEIPKFDLQGCRVDGGHAPFPAVPLSRRFVREFRCDPFADDPFRGTAGNVVRGRRMRCESQ